MVVLFAVALTWSTAVAYSQESELTGRGRPLAIIEPGTQVGNQKSRRWNRTILLARPRIASGDTDAISSSIKNSVAKFTLSILATVNLQQAAPEDGAVNSGPARGKYILSEIGVGYVAEVGAKSIVISSDAASKLGLKLSFVESRMLAENEKQIEQLRSLVHTTTLAIFDAPAIMVRDQRHQEMTVRHLIWIDPDSGRTATLVWLLRQLGTGINIVETEPLQLIAEATYEDRAIHVDGNEFFLGVPSKRAFALEKLTPGQPIPWTDELRASAGATTYDVVRLRTLINAISAAMNSRS